MIANRKIFLTLSVVAVIATTFSLKSDSSMDSSAATKDQLIEKLYSLQYNKETLYKSLVPPLTMMAMQQGISDEQTEQFIKKVFDNYIENMQQEIMSFYRENFEIAEINAMIVYSESPVGRKIVSKQEELGKIIQKCSLELIKIVQEVAAELQAPSITEENSLEKETLS